MSMVSLWHLRPNNQLKPAKQKNICLKYQFLTIYALNVFYGHLNETCIFFLCSKTYFSALVWCVNTVLWTLVQFFLYFMFLLCFFSISLIKWGGLAVKWGCVVLNDVYKLAESYKKPNCPVLKAAYKIKHEYKCLLLIAQETMHSMWSIDLKKNGEHPLLYLISYSTRELFTVHWVHLT